MSKYTDDFFKNCFDYEVEVMSGMKKDFGGFENDSDFDDLHIILTDLIDSRIETAEVQTAKRLYRLLRNVDQLAFELDRERSKVFKKIQEYEYGNGN